jgi:hypothetical protein
MKKTLASALLLGLFAYGCVKDNNKNLFAKIAKDKSFKMQEYDKYFLGANHEEGDDMIIVGYDLNGDGKADCIAKAKVIGQEGEFYTTFPYAVSLTVNPDANGSYDKFYFDKDGDGKFDMVLQHKESDPESDDNSVSI